MNGEIMIRKQDVTKEEIEFVKELKSLFLSYGVDVETITDFSDDSEYGEKMILLKGYNINIDIEALSDKR